MTAVDREHAARLVTHLSQQRSSGKYCDVCVCVAEQRFLAHKCVLSANSDQLDALILDATDEDNTSHDIEIEIHGVSPVGFEIVLEYFYTGVLRLEPSTVRQTWMTAIYLGLPDIVTRCNGYCQQSTSVSAHLKVSNGIQPLAPASLPAPSQTAISSARVDMNNNGNVIAFQEASSDRTGAAPAQMTTNSVLCTSSIQPKVSSIIKEKEVIITEIPENGGKAIGLKPVPFEIRENHPTVIAEKQQGLETASKKSKLMTMDETALEWNPYNSQAAVNSQAGVAMPVASMPQVVVNLVQGYGTYQPVDLNWSSTGQQWAQVQVGKGQFVTTGMIPLASQVKSETVPTPVTAVQIINQDNSNSSGMTEGGQSAGESSPISYTTLSLVSQDPPSQSEPRNEMEPVPSEPTTEQQPPPPEPRNIPSNEQSTPIVVPIVPASQTQPQPVLQPQELNLDSIHFTQLPPVNIDQSRANTTQQPFSTVTTSSTYIQPVTLLNNLTMSSSSSGDTRCETVMMQSQVEQLRIQHQQLQRLQQENEKSENNLGSSDLAEKSLVSSKRKRKAPTRVSKSEDGNGNTHELHAHSTISKSRSVADSTMQPITREHIEFLYQKYPEIKREPIVSGTCDVMQLLQHGKARQRKSSEQNALNNTIRTILDTTGIIESGDSRVQDAVCLIMDRFAVLQEHMNDPYVRKQLTVKVKHSIHCKKWRLKRHKMKQLEMSSSSSPDPQQTTTWITDANASGNISLASDSSLLNEESLHS